MATLASWANNNAQNKQAACHCQLTACVHGSRRLGLCRCDDGAMQFYDVDDVCNIVGDVCGNGPIRCKGDHTLLIMVRCSPLSKIFAVEIAGVTVFENGNATYRIWRRHSSNAATPPIKLVTAQKKSCRDWMLDRQGIGCWIAKEH
jgi:hypothetical protein